MARKEMAYRDFYMGGYRLASQSHWVGLARTHEAIMAGIDTPDNEPWYRGHMAACVARAVGVDLSNP